MIRTRNALCFILFTVFSPHLLWAQPQSSPPVWTVQEAVQFALEHNPDALTAQARISAADADIRAARAAFYPQLGVSGEYSRTDNPMYSFGNILTQGLFTSDIDFNDPGTTDTLALARELYPGKRNSLDALCERLMVPNRHRTLHGALLDAELLAEVFLSMGSIEIEAPLEAYGSEAGDGDDRVWPPAGLVVRQPTAAERQAHEAMLDIMAKQTKRDPLWRGPAASGES